MSAVKLDKNPMDVLAPMLHRIAKGNKLEVDEKWISRMRRYANENVQKGNNIMNKTNEEIRAEATERIGRALRQLSSVPMTSDRKTWVINELAATIKAVGRIKTVSLILLMTLLSGCGQSEVVLPAEHSQMREVASARFMTVYVVAVDGEDFVIVASSSGAVAVCRKTN